MYLSNRVKVAKVLSGCSFKFVNNIGSGLYLHLGSVDNTVRSDSIKCRYISCSVHVHSSIGLCTANLYKRAARDGFQQFSITDMMMIIACLMITMIRMRILMIIIIMIRMMMMIKNLVFMSFAICYIKVQSLMQ